MPIYSEGVQLNTSIHQGIHFLIQQGHGGGLEPIPAVTGREAGYALNMLLVYYKTGNCSLLHPNPQPI